MNKKGFCYAAKTRATNSGSKNPKYKLRLLEIFAAAPTPQKRSIKTETPLNESRNAVASTSCSQNFISCFLLSQNSSTKVESSKRVWRLVFSVVCNFRQRGRTICSQRSTRSTAHFSNFSATVIA